MSDVYDRLETRTPAARESALFRDLRHVLTVSQSRVPALRMQLKGVDVAKLSRRGDLERIPLRRRSDHLAAQADQPPFGGYAATRLGAAAQAFVEPDDFVSLQGQAKDWFGMGRALFAAGLRKGMLALNCFDYDLVPMGHMIEAGTRAVGAPVVPAGNACVARVAEVVARLKPKFFCGPADRLKSLLDHGIDSGADMTSLKAALVTESMTPGLRNELDLRKIAVRQAFVLPEVGLVAFQSAASTHMILNEGLILEIIPDQTIAAGSSKPDGELEGEIVVTRINADVPLLRYATGTRSKIVGQGSTCGRTNLLIKAPVACDGDRGASRIGPAHVAEIARRHPQLGRMRLFMRRPREHDVLHLKVEHGGDEPALGERLSQTLQLVTSLRGTVEFVRPGSLQDDDDIVVDERSYE